MEDRTLPALKGPGGVVDQSRFLDAPPATVTAALASPARVHGHGPTQWPTCRRLVVQLAAGVDRWEATAPSWTGTAVELRDQKLTLAKYSLWWD